jgi:F-box protein 9
MEDNAELESFRRQWREEVARRTKQNKPSPSQSKPSASTTTRPPTTQQFPPTHHEASQRKGEDDGDGAAATLDQGEIIQGVSQLSLHPPDDDAFNNQVPRKEPKSALEHFERAVEKEAEGNLGDSLQLYRKAYRVCRRPRSMKIMETNSVVSVARCGRR